MKKASPELPTCPFYLFFSLRGSLSSVRTFWYAPGQPSASIFVMGFFQDVAHLPGEGFPREGLLQEWNPLL